ncbi:Txe/YoeB family addiction module toxin [Streptomyces sp. HNM0575]|uniref:Txe/YoeB family addiction module toxin n=1 Tax=Streptomyces sp. HNM0575 TaxID=2716338 RepID=UPI0032162A17
MLHVYIVSTSRYPVPERARKPAPGTEGPRPPLLGGHAWHGTTGHRLIEESKRDPFAGIGKPEPLKGDLSGYWSRRIDDEHKLVYRAEGDELIVVQARYHY